MSALGGRILYAGQLSVAGGDTVTAVGALNTDTEITYGVIANTGGVVAVINVCLVPYLSVPGPTFRVVNAYNLQPNDTLSLRNYLVGATLGGGDFVTVSSSVANAVNVAITGRVSL